MSSPARSNRRLVLGIVVGALVPAFAATQIVVSQYRRNRQALSVEWSARGAHDIGASPSEAVSDFETALAYDPDRVVDRFSLARALVAAERPGEARAQLITLWADEPGDGEINLELARLAAHHGDEGDAVRYYHGAIDGAWSANAGTSRRTARLELARLLMADSQQARAQAELIALVDDLPPEPRLLTDVGGLLVDAGAPARALPLFRRALALDPADQRAEELAGEVEFQGGNVRAAHRDLTVAAGRGPIDADAQDMLDVSGRVLVLDPYAAGIGARGRADRALRAAAIAKARIAGCQPPAAPDSSLEAHLSDLSTRIAAKEKRGRAALERDADSFDDTMAAVFDAEKLPDGACGPASADDRALAVISGQHGGQPQ